MNRVGLIGRLTKDPELRQASGSASCRFTLAAASSITRAIDKGTQSGGYHWQRIIDPDWVNGLAADNG